MLDRFVLGTANFSQGYGILSQGMPVPENEVRSILKESHALGISLLDTALSYGDMDLYAEEMKLFKIISKWRVADSLEDTYIALKKTLENLSQPRFYALLIHDPQNLAHVSVDKVLSFCQRLKDEGLCEKIGISIYDENDWKSCLRIMNPEIVQLPLNPMNQLLNKDDLKQELADRGVEVHARSLFLQGVLLEDVLPHSLSDLQKIWKKFMELLPSGHNKLTALMSWAASQKWVSRWVVGAASSSHLVKLSEAIRSHGHIAPCFDELRGMYHPMVDPRNWKVS